MSRTHGKSGGRKGPMNLADILMAIQAGRWAFDYDVEARPSRKGRDDNSDDLKIRILKLVENKARRGDQLVEALAETGKRGKGPGPELVYPMLSMLEDGGLIKSKTTEKKGKRYRITKAGRAELEETPENVESLMRRSVRPERMGSEERRAVKNAMSKLATALAQRMVTKGVDDELLAEVAKIVDEAAKRIERL